MWMGPTSPSADVTGCERSLGRPEAVFCGRRRQFETSRGPSPWEEGTTHENRGGEKRSGARRQGGYMNKLQTAVTTRLALALAGLATPTLKREEGQTFVEYAMILAIVAIIVVGALTFLRDQINAA